MEISSTKNEGIEYFLNILKQKTTLMIKKNQKQTSQNSIPSSEVYDGQSNITKIESSKASEPQINELSHNPNPPTPNNLRGRQKTPPKVIEENFKRKQQFQQNQAKGFQNLMQNTQQKSQTQLEQTQPANLVQKDEDSSKLVSQDESRISQEEINQTKQQQEQQQHIQEEIVQETLRKQENILKNNDTIEENALVYSFNNNQNQQLGYLSFKKDSQQANSPNLSKSNDQNIESQQKEKVDDLNNSQKYRLDDQQLKPQINESQNSNLEKQIPETEQIQSLLQSEVQQEIPNTELNSSNHTSEQKQISEDQQQKQQKSLEDNPNQQKQINIQEQQIQQEQPKQEEQQIQKEQISSLEQQNKLDQKKKNEPLELIDNQLQSQQQDVLLQSAQIEQPQRSQSQNKELQNQQQQINQQELPKRKESQQKQEQKNTNSQNHILNQEKEQKNHQEKSNKQQQQSPQHQNQISKVVSKQQEYSNPKEQSFLLEKKESQEQIQPQNKIKTKESIKPDELMKPQEQINLQEKQDLIQQENEKQTTQIIPNDKNQNQIQENKTVTENLEQQIQKQESQVNQEKQIIQKSEDPANLKGNNQILSSSNQIQNKEGQPAPKQKVSINKIAELQKNMKKLQDLERIKINKQRLDSSISSSSSLPIGNEVVSKVLPSPLIDNPKKNQNILSNDQRLNQTENVKDQNYDQKLQNTQIKELQKQQEPNNQTNNSIIPQNNQNEQHEVSEKNNNSQIKNQNLEEDEDQVKKSKKDSQNSQKNDQKIQDIVVQNANTDHHSQDSSNQINISNISADKIQTNIHLQQQQQSTERTPIFNMQNNSSLYQNGQGSSQFKVENSSPTNYQKLAPVRQQLDKDPKIASVMAQNYLKNNINNHQADEDRYKQNGRSSSQIKSSLINKNLNLDLEKLNDSIENSSIDDTQRQLKDLDQQINEIIQSDSDRQFKDQNQKQITQNKIIQQSKNKQDENDSNFFSNAKFDGDKMLQTKIKEKQNPESLYVDQKKENSSRFTESAYNVQGYESNGSGKGSSPSKKASPPKRISNSKSPSPSKSHSPSKSLSPSKSSSPSKSTQKNQKTSQQSQRGNTKQSNQNISQDINQDDSFMDVRLQTNQRDSSPSKLVGNRGSNLNSVNSQKSLSNQKNLNQKTQDNKNSDNLNKNNQKNYHQDMNSPKKNKIENVLQQSKGSNQKQKDSQYDDKLLKDQQIRDKKNETFDNLDKKNPQLESNLTQYEQILLQQLNNYPKQKKQIRLGDQVIQEEQGSEMNSHTNDNSDVCPSPYTTDCIQQTKKMKSPQKQKKNLEQQNQKQDQQVSLDKTKIKQVHLKIEQPNNQQNQKFNQINTKSPNKNKAISLNKQNSSQSNQSQEDSSSTQKYYSQQNYDNIQQYVDQDTSLEKKEKDLYNELKNDLNDETKGNFSNFKMSSKGGVMIVETDLQKTKKAKNKDDQQTINLSDLTVKHFKNNESPLVLKLDLSQKASPSKELFSDKKNQFRSPSSTYHSQSYSGNKAGVHSNNNIFNKDLASSIECQEGGDFLTNNSANEAGVFYNTQEFVNNKNFNNSDDYSYNSHDLKNSHVRGHKSSYKDFSKRAKHLIILNIDFDEQDIEVKVYPDDTAFTVAERICNIIQKVITREQMRNLASIIQKRINEYTLQLELVVQEIETQKLKEKDVLDRFIQERNIRESIQNPIYKNQNISINDKQYDDIIGKLTIQLSHTNKKQGIIRVREKDDPHELAFSFINTYNIKKNKVSFLVEKILEIQNEYRAKQLIKHQMNYEQSSNTMNEIQHMPFKEVQGYYSAEQLSKLSPQRVSSPLNKTSSPIHLNQVQFKGQFELFRVNIDKGNGDYIKIIIKEGDNLKSVAYQVATDNQLNTNAYEKILKTLESAFKNHLENQWQAF